MSVNYIIINIYLAIKEQAMEQSTSWEGYSVSDNQERKMNLV
jgi:hypothetical protein